MAYRCMSCNETFDEPPEDLDPAEPDVPAEPPEGCGPGGSVAPARGLCHGCSWAIEDRYSRPVHLAAGLRTLGDLMIEAYVRRAGLLAEA